MTQECRNLTAEQREMVRKLIKMKPDIYIESALENKVNRIAIEGEGTEYIDCLAVGSSEMVYETDPEHSAELTENGFWFWFNRRGFKLSEEGSAKILLDQLLAELTPGVVYRFLNFTKEELEA
jgi:hypothetical protein